MLAIGFLLAMAILTVGICLASTEKFLKLGELIISLGVILISFIIFLFVIGAFVLVGSFTDLVFFPF